MLFSIVSLILPLAASAAVSGDFTYTDNGASVTIDGCNGGASACPATLTIPASIGGDPVTSIGASAFLNASGVTSVTIPSSVTSIGASAFKGATSLRAVTFAGTSQLTSIGASVFEGATSLTSITIPSTVTSIESAAFKTATSLTSVFYTGNAPTVGTSIYQGSNAGLVSYRFSSATGWPEVGSDNWPVGDAHKRATALATVPATPPAPTAIYGNGSVAVTVAAGSGGTPPESYTVTASPGGGTCTVTGAALSCTVTGLTNGTSYTFTVTATNAAGTSSSSPASSVVTPMTLPGAPTSVAGVSGNTQVVVSWSAPVSNGGSTITAYTVTTSPGGRTCGLSSGALSCTISGLTNGTAYTFTVTATNTVGTSNSSPATSAVTPATLPDAPTSVAGVSGNTQVVVSWSAPVSNGGAVITAYTVTASPGGQTCSWSSGALSCTVTGLTNGTSYTFTVTATNTAGTSSPSPASSAVTPMTVPDAPTSVGASRGNTHVVVSWLAPVSNGGSTITAYTVTASPGGRTCGVSSGTLSCTISGLTNGTSYTFTVTATNAVGTSSPSPADSAVPATPTPPFTVGTFHDHVSKGRTYLTSQSTVPYAGKVTHTITTGSGKKKKTWHKDTQTFKAAGSYKLTCDLSAKDGNYLRRNALKLTITTTLRPSTGTAVTTRIKVMTLRRS